MFESYKIFIQLNKIITVNEKNSIIENSKKYLDILSNFKNINYTNYIELLNLFENDLSDEDKKQPFDKQKIIIESRNDILYSLAIFVMELITKKAELILSRNLKFSRYNAKYLFQNCIKIKELFIKSERDLSRNFELRNRYKICVEKCNEEN